MSEPGATARRRRSRRAAAPRPSRVRRSLVAIATVILVITPISWILLHEPQSDQADASVPYVTRDDDTYITASNQPVADDTAPPSTPPTTPPTPGATPSTAEPSTPPTPGETPTSIRPTTRESGDPTARPTRVPTPVEETGGPTQQPTRTPPKSPTAGPTSTPTPSTSEEPQDDGNMSAAEEELFALVDNERQTRGCAPLRRENDLSAAAQADAERRAENGDVSGGSSSSAAAGGDDVSAKEAFDRLKEENSGTLFNCGLTELGVGRGDATREKTGLCSLIGTCDEVTRYVWVVRFD